ncbi:MAG: glycyl-radical enzyme activating protein [Moorellales bacterium]
MAEVRGMVFNIQRYSIDDGPGIRTTVFLKGCPLRCLWCSNPESQSADPEVVHRDSLCIRCGRCVEVCPKHAIALTEKGVGIARGLCECCGRCVEVCDPGALKMLGSEMSVQEVFAEVRRDRSYYEYSCGGVTVSGGEPLQQPEFVAELFVRCQKAGIHTCLDTSGYADREALEKVLPHTDLVLFDLKHPDPEVHRRLTGVGISVILRNLRHLVEKGKAVVIRIPVVPGYNDRPEEVRSQARVVADLGLGRVDLMPYHRLGVGKYQMLDRSYGLLEVTPPSREQLENIRQTFEAYGIDCRIRL